MTNAKKGLRRPNMFESSRLSGLISPSSSRVIDLLPQTGLNDWIKMKVGIFFFVINIPGSMLRVCPKQT